MFLQRSALGGTAGTSTVTVVRFGLRPSIKGADVRKQKLFTGPSTWYLVGTSQKMVSTFRKFSAQINCSP